MGSYYLVKILDKKQFIRLLNLYKSNIIFSSIYKINYEKYILVFLSDKQLQFIKNSVNIVIDQYNLFEKFIYNWSLAELLQNINFIKLESQSFYSLDGRYIELFGQRIIRTKEILTEIFAILNYTIDSFSDGGVHQNIDELLMYAEKQILAGANVLDIGVASTNPNSQLMSSDIEINKFKQILPQLINLKTMYGVKLSVDTYNMDTIKWLLDKDIEFINDVSASITNDLLHELIKNEKFYIAMHSITIPARKDMHIEIEKDPIEYINIWIKDKQIQYSHINIDKIIFDPGIGFGKLSQQSWYIIKNIDRIKQLGINLLVGHSRKSFLTHLIGDTIANQRDYETSITSFVMVNKVNYLRLHNLENFFYSYSLYRDSLK
jgi:dihydropteroate synthase